jgi:hypothetical protein
MYEDGTQTMGVFVESVNETGAEIVYASDAGPGRSASMGWERHKGAWKDDSLQISRTNGRVLTLRLSPDGTGMLMEHRNAAGVLTKGVLKPAS